MKKRKKHTPEKKAEMVIKVLKEEQTLAQIASEYGIHPNQIGKWKTEFLKNAPMIFTNEHKPVNELKVKYEQQLDTLWRNRQTYHSGKLAEKQIWNYTGAELNVWI